ncbi:class F sortase [Cellulomonas telluris]|uniref:class F sortase n=1 Tax=Cellulomonas telluris TaxID=2306636 RepID=UPI0010A7F9B7|nr:class F sortase [Cellulomonas telluris]
MSTAPRRPARRLALVATAALGAVCLTAGVRLATAPPRLDVAPASLTGVVPDAPGRTGTGTPASTPPAPAPPDPAPPAAAPPVPAPPAPTPPPAPAPPVPPLVPAPDRLRVPDAAVDVAVVPVGVGRGGALELPEAPDAVGWWLAGATPGAPAGSLVLAGHVDTVTGPGVMADVLDAPLGAVVEVGDGRGGTVAYRLVERRVLPKSAPLPDELFAAAGPHRLVLVTCGGAFDRRTRHYSENVVLLADPVG